MKAVLADHLEELDIVAIIDVRADYHRAGQVECFLKRGFDLIGRPDAVDDGK